MNINDKIIKHYLKNVMFITGTAYAGKSIMVKMLSEKYSMIHCGENYHGDLATSALLTPEQYPNLCYFQTMKDWQEFLNRTPDEYANWIFNSKYEIAEFEIAELMSISSLQKVIVDTNIPLEILHKIADYHQVAVMLSPQSLSVDKFFDRNDPDKQFILSQIQKAENPEKTMQNFRECIAKINSKEIYDKYANSGFFTIVRENADIDTRYETLDVLAKHFKLESSVG